MFKKKMDRAQQEQIWSEFYKNRQEQFALMQKRFISDWLPKMRSSNYKRFATAQLNNAVLLHYKTYMDDLSEFEALYNRLGKDFYKFMEFSKGLEKSKDPRAALKAAIKEPTP